MTNEYLYKLISGFFKTTKKEAQILKKVMSNPNLTVIALYNFGMFLQALKSKIPISRIFSLKGKLYGD